MLRLTAFTLFLMTASLPAFAAPTASPAPLVSPAPADVDLLPLKKALAPLDGMGPLRSHSTLRMSGTRSGVSVLLREDLQIISRRPGRFRASLTQYDTTGGSRKKLVVISNGASVWTYRPGLRQYSVSTLPAFEKDDSDIPTLGLVIGGFYLGEGHPLVEGMHSVTPANNDAVLTILGSMGITLSRETKSMRDHDEYVYSLTLTKQNLAYQFYVNTQTSALARVELTGTQNGTQFFYREDILSITPQTPAQSTAFVFTPPPGTTKTLSTPNDFSQSPPAAFLDRPPRS